MIKTLSFFAAILVLVPCLSGPALAAREKRKPWLSISRSEKQVKAPARPKVVAAKPVARPVVRQVQKPEPLTAHSDKGKNIARQALAYKGTKYKFGGTSKKGLDCSGLVARVYNDLKMGQVPRVSASLYKTGDPVKIAQLRPGDLVFFKNTYKRGISHVGVYAGRNKFVHASNKRRGVIVTSLADPYYQLHYAGARRLY